MLLCDMNKKQICCYHNFCLQTFRASKNILLSVTKELTILKGEYNVTSFSLSCFCDYTKICCYHNCCLQNFRALKPSCFSRLYKVNTNFCTYPAARHQMNDRINDRGETTLWTCLLSLSVLTVSKVPTKYISISTIFVATTKMCIVLNVGRFAPCFLSTCRTASSKSTRWSDKGLLYRHHYCQLCSFAKLPKGSIFSFSPFFQ